MEDSDMVRVAEEPPVPYTIKPNRQVTLPGPDGFDHYEWSVDGRTVASTKDYDISFKQTSDLVTVSCKATSKTGDQITKLRQISYAVTVKR